MSAKLALRDDERAALTAGVFRFDRWRTRLAAEPIPASLTRAWRPLIPHPEQVRLAQSPARFKIVAADRRSGKTMRALRHLVKKAMAAQNVPDAFYFYAAPTRDQAKRVAWEYLKALVPPWARDHSRGRSGISESDLTIHLCQGANLAVVGMDRPQRLEGIALDGGILDEYAEMKPEAWTSTVRPALDTLNRPGWCWFVGRPKGTNHFYDLVRDFGQDPAMTDWDFFTWWSEDIASEQTIADARRDLDPRTFEQEYRAAFVNQEGRVYYAFDRNVHASERLHYDATLPLVLCFDFNVDPGVCVYVQEQPYTGTRSNVAPNFTAVIGEVFIPNNSNTPAVCAAILNDFGKGGRIAEHRGEVYIYGDPAGGARKTSGTDNSDWDMIRAHLRPTFGARYHDRVASADPGVKPRVNCLNSRLIGADGTVKMLVDPVNAKRVVADLEDVTWKEGVFEIEKPHGSMLSHVSDALAYYAAEKHPVYTLTGSPVRAL